MRARKCAMGHGPQLLRILSLTGRHNGSWDTRAVRTGRQWKKHCRTTLFSRKFCIRRVLRHTSRHNGPSWRTSHRPSGRAVCLRTRPDGPVTTRRHDGSCVAGLKNNSEIADWVWRAWPCCLESTSIPETRPILMTQHNTIQESFTCEDMII